MAYFNNLTLMMSIMFNNKIFKAEMPHMKLIIYKKVLMRVLLVINKSKKSNRTSKSNSYNYLDKITILMIKKLQLIKLK